MDKIKIIYIENNGIDAELVALSLKDHADPADIVVVDDRETFCHRLDTEKFDLVLMDYDVPNLSAKEAIHIIKEKKIEVPIIIISGAIGYEAAIRLIKQGAQDYVLKENLVVLPSTIRRVLSEYQETMVKKKRANAENEVINVTRTGVFKMDDKGRCFFVNQPLCDMLGYSQAELTSGDGWLQYLSIDNKTEFVKTFHQRLSLQAPFELEVKLLTKHSKEICVKCNFIPELLDKNNVEYLGAMVDITHLKKTEDELKNLSMHDPLTGLPNRRYFSDFVQKIVHECERGLLNAFAVFYIDLDHFKKINDVLGHHIGDELLKQVAERLKANARKYDMIARIGGDEFLIVLKYVNSIGELAFIADNFLTKFRTPFYVEDNECLATLSIGIAYVDNTSDGVNAEKIIQKADQALYRAKARGRNCYEIYTDNISHEIQHTVFIENALRHAIEKKELSLFFQPQINLLKSCIHGFEALLRWNQDVYGEIPPSVFVPIAEESGQMKEVGAWVIDTALTAYKKFDQASLYFRRHAVSMGINVSATQLLQDNFIQKLSEKVKEYDVDYRRIMFEITETSVVQNIAQLKKQFMKTPITEFSLGVDDFGAGYSSFTNLKELPIKLLKIDQSFVQEIDNDPNCKNIIKSIISLAMAMNITLIAEGVETQSQVDFLLKSGCYIFQGYFFSKAMPMDDVEEYIKHFDVSQKKINF
ncbi:MAG: hypothetical protein A3I77_02545 [Gammaproteobacteria bacterium RIFCSPLOWO2_02_FULL_42_14]|nr:MAG: hypothetical protein A3B71_02385 [Gammaproteobacteria bacterium RIFCSPHIGHO2_02_FULL_42_43]OGT53531.1 MAG: hypothetical protein A3E54_02410 [Gammaproteobacteria bacterium RIFCSPHIGHO2_12_FULL_41_25]OGT61475.1 MAG: hypothetical protein A3I77_02545 [Gammaproteobacteria bacterium RIFCSPLOWO2_02_FULL_42_14]OGT86757.1 MAG: hypothetical protein A3G86_05335 [Gammaproteobacteria bacterium RIFCSPLOWO2_12_FULL_42_18]